MSEFSAVVKLWRVADERALANYSSLPPGTQLLSRGAMTLGSPVGNEPVPVLVDHDEAQPPIGVVNSLEHYPESDGTTWLYALCTIDRAPAWLRKGTAASMSSQTIQRTTYGPLTRVLRGFLREVSLLSPGVRPVEPQARVVVYTEQTGEVLSARGLIQRPCGGSIIAIR